MPLENPFQGQLFANGFLCGSIAETGDWQYLDGAAFERLRVRLRALFDRFPADRAPNEAQTETDLIRPVLERLRLDGEPLATAAFGARAHPCAGRPPVRR